MDTNELESPSLVYTLPPEGLVMPQQAQEVALWVFGGLAIVFAVWGLYLAAKNKSALPLILVIAAFLCCILEPITNVLGNIIHPPVGQIHAFAVEGHPVPWHIAIAYLPLFTFIIFPFYRSFTERTLTPAFWWKSALFVAIGFVALVHFFLQTGVWVYYGVHGLKFGYVSAAMLSANVAVLIGVPLIVYALLPALSGWKQWLVIPLMPCLASGIHTAVHAPAYMVLGQDTGSIAQWIIHAGVLVSFLCGILVIWSMLQLVYRES